MALCCGAASLHAQANAVPRVRAGRIIGVYDDATGRPVEGALVEDALTGWTAQTSATGTVSLFYVDTGGTLLRVKKLGYAPMVFPVKNSERDTIPVTVVLRPVTALPTAVIRGRRSRGPADTVRRLDEVGFYDRRNSSAAPTSAFVTEDRVARFTRISDVPAITGRPICEGNLYIDGMLITPMSEDAGVIIRSRGLGKKPVDFLVWPEAVAAIEFYRPSEMPAEYNRTHAGELCGATLIWTK